MKINGSTYLIACHSILIFFPSKFSSLEYVFDQIDIHMEAGGVNERWIFDGHHSLSSEEMSKPHYPDANMSEITKK